VGRRKARSKRAKNVSPIVNEKKTASTNEGSSNADRTSDVAKLESPKPVETSTKPPQKNTVDILSNSEDKGKDSKRPTAQKPPGDKQKTPVPVNNLKDALSMLIAKNERRKYLVAKHQSASILEETGIGPERLREISLDTTHPLGASIRSVFVGIILTKVLSLMAAHPERNKWVIQEVYGQSGRFEKAWKALLADTQLGRDLHEVTVYTHREIVETADVARFSGPEQPRLPTADINILIDIYADGPDKMDATWLDGMGNQCDFLLIARKYLPGGDYGASTEAVWRYYGNQVEYFPDSGATPPYRHDTTCIPPSGFLQIKDSTTACSWAWTPLLRCQHDPGEILFFTKIPRACSRPQAFVTQPTFSEVEVQVRKFGEGVIPNFLSRLTGQHVAVSEAATEGLGVDTMGVMVHSSIDHVFRSCSSIHSIWLKSTDSWMCIRKECPDVTLLVDRFPDLEARWRPNVEALRSHYAHQNATNAGMLHMMQDDAAQNWVPRTRISKVFFLVLIALLVFYETIYREVTTPRTNSHFPHLNDIEIDVIAGLGPVLLAIIMRLSGLGYGTGQVIFEESLLCFQVWWFDMSLVACLFQGLGFELLHVTVIELRAPSQLFIRLLRGALMGMTIRVSMFLHGFLHLANNQLPGMSKMMLHTARPLTDHQTMEAARATYESRSVFPFRTYQNLSNPLLVGEDDQSVAAFRAALNDGPLHLTPKIKTNDLRATMLAKPKSYQTIWGNVGCQFLAPGNGDLALLSALVSRVFNERAVPHHVQVRNWASPPIQALQQLMIDYVQSPSSQESLHELQENFLNGLSNNVQLHRSAMARIRLHGVDPNSAGAPHKVFSKSNETLAAKRGDKPLRVKTRIIVNVAPATNVVIGPEIKPATKWLYEQFRSGQPIYIGVWTVVPVICIGMDAYTLTVWLNTALTAGTYTAYVFQFSDDHCSVINTPHGFVYLWGDVAAADHDTGLGPHAFFWRMLSKAGVSDETIQYAETASRAPLKVILKDAKAKYHVFFPMDEDGFRIQMVYSGSCYTSAIHSVVWTMIPLRAFQCLSVMAPNCPTATDIFAAYADAAKHLGVGFTGGATYDIHDLNFLKFYVVDVVDGPFRYAFAPSVSRVAKLFKCTGPPAAYFTRELRHIAGFQRHKIACLLFNQGVYNSWKGLIMHPVVKAAFEASGLLYHARTLSDFNWIEAGTDMSGWKVDWGPTEHRWGWLSCTTAEICRGIYHTGAFYNHPDLVNIICQDYGA